MHWTLHAAHGGAETLPASIEAARNDTAVVALAGPAPVTGPVTEHVLPGPAGPLRARSYRPLGAGEQGPPLPGIFYFHSGGFVLGGLDSHHSWVSALSNATGRIVVAVDYRLAPEHRFPAAAQDAYAAIRHIAGHAPDFGIDVARLSVAGDSAGANLAGAVNAEVIDAALGIIAGRLHR
ncbi:alpha/beta hydrolase fold domain-containing protein [Streptomyces sp. H27-C3]|uniref:alpha/beta hydrolase fold domain-containing protein n=1 Tax=Streptomyces sp. H27-C3 TaxID=3046305 RepID=UPI0024B9A841|nr:alpha/beta hydrolase fold domain-containing protein [Streptomyces sp. H27-C3]MDJ0463878.1 alpha/beta hydrolase fold domain-containing protein [Streptomyces sp. H27-C3]